MRKFIQNYSILVFPAIAGCLQLALMFGMVIDKLFYYFAVLGTIMTILVLAPMLHLSNNKSKIEKIFRSFIALVLFYFLGLILNFILVEDLEIFGKPSINSKREYISVAFECSLWCLIVFFPANIAVVLAFLLNDIYAKKIGKIICRKEEVEDEI